MQSDINALSGGALSEGTREEESLSYRLNEILKQKGWTRYRLSKESGVPVSTIYGIFNRNIGISFRNIQKIANALGTSDFI
ncbi:hypothetical protein PSTEL_09525 [Paenibacillus stellifer]|uniref:HTH cro/C1-type domain-containing protein n=1 Tax=Paenibacillus stellifer TaxID=169760 RepID=A0A089N3K9_9BACL|nr:helix-turn-helix transcriptional regulator [Paenibacillus stellifer]AIQ63294.1 hypothetical protein PSTEL_09525 [Paenibacillus stellifer]